MLERDQYPPGVPCWVDTAQPDPEAAASFYGGLFGWEFEDAMPPDSPGRYLVGRLQGRTVAAVGSQLEGMPPAPVWRTYVCVESADAAVAGATGAGGAVLMEPFDVLDAGRMAVLADTEGAALCVWQPGRTAGAQLVNVPGTWSFSGLNTRDPQAARGFYRALFGWEAETIGGSEGGFTFWRRPGYGDHLERRDPGLRERLTADGAPPGFEDAVAWLTPMTSDRFPEDAPPHWGVTFSVDDADAVADRAATLGGAVLVPPLDAPWVRVAVLSDPQGAVFTVTRYMPPER